MKITRNIIFNKAGGNSGKNTMSYKISLPADMVRFLGVTHDDRTIILETIEDKQEIRLKKINKK